MAKIPNVAQVVAKALKIFGKGGAVGSDLEGSVANSAAAAESGFVEAIDSCRYVVDDLVIALETYFKDHGHNDAEARNIAESARPEIREAVVAQMIHSVLYNNGFTKLSTLYARALQKAMT